MQFSIIIIYSIIIIIFSCKHLKHSIVPSRCQAQRAQAGPRLHVQRRGKHGAGGAELVSQRC